MKIPTFLLVLVFNAATAYAEITFESGFVESQIITSGITDPDNGVTVVISRPPGQTDRNIAQVGLPLASFTPDDGAGTPTAAGGNQFFLNAAANGINLCFDRRIRALSMDIFDLRADGPEYLGNFATLEVFAEPCSGNLPGATSVGSISTVPVDGTEPEGNRTQVAISDVGNFQSARLRYSISDGGTGIDNIVTEIGGTTLTRPDDPPPTPCSEGGTFCSNGQICGKPCQEPTNHCVFSIPTFFFGRLCVNPYFGIVPEEMDYNMQPLDFRCMDPALVCETRATEN